ncbi:MAG: hypothetical protein WD708_11565 [Kiritimatiellia bacterium]
MFRSLIRAQDEVMAGRSTPEAAAADAANRINDDIQRTLSQREDLRLTHEKMTAVQQKIDAARGAGEPVPLDWITNPFHRAYYAHQGWLTHE